MANHMAEVAKILGVEQILSGLCPTCQNKVFEEV